MYLMYFLMQIETRRNRQWVIARNEDLQLADVIATCVVVNGTPRIYCRVGGVNGLPVARVPWLHANGSAAVSFFVTSSVSYIYF